MSRTSRHLDDAALVDGAQQGDPSALDELLRRHYDRLRAVCRRIAGTSRDGDDAAQEAMIRIVRSITGFDGRSSFGTWSHRIAVNAALDELRRRQRRPQLHAVDPGASGEAAGVEPIDPLAERTVTAATERMAIEAALAGLAEEFRVPVVLRDVADLDYAEIAAVLEVPVGTVKSRIARGRRLMLEQLGNHDASGRRPTGQDQGHRDD